MEFQCAPLRSWDFWTNEESICYRTYSAMAEALSLVRECSTGLTSQHRFSKQHLGGTCVLREAEKYIVQKLLLAEVINTSIKLPWKLARKSFGTKPYTTAYPFIQTMQKRNVHCVIRTEEPDLCLLEHFITEHTKCKGTFCWIHHGPLFFQSCSVLFKYVYLGLCPSGTITHEDWLVMTVR